MNVFKLILFAVGRTLVGALGFLGHLVVWLGILIPVATFFLGPLGFVVAIVLFVLDTLRVGSQRRHKRLVAAVEARQARWRCLVFVLALPAVADAGLIAVEQIASAGGNRVEHFDKYPHWQPVVAEHEHGRAWVDVFNRNGSPKFLSFDFEGGAEGNARASVEFLIELTEDAMYGLKLQHAHSDLPEAVFGSIGPGFYRIAASAKSGQTFSGSFKLNQSVPEPRSFGLLFLVAIFLVVAGYAERAHRIRKRKGK